MKCVSQRVLASGRAGQGQREVHRKLGDGIMALQHVAVTLGNGGTLSIEGNGFNVDFQNEVAAGTVDTLRYSEGGTTLLEWSDLGMSLNDMMRLIAFENELDPVAIEERMVSGDDSLISSGGNDILYGGAGNDYFDAGAGFDTVLYRESRNERTVTANPDGSILVSNASETDRLVNVERIQFSDGTLAFDLSGNAGQAYRIYQAAFDRTPDTAGLSHWIKAMDAGATLDDVAAGFMSSAEFIGLYGTNPSNNEFVDRLYDNVLGREGDSGGIAYWVGQLEAGYSRAHLLAGFAESTENVAGVAPAIADGIWYA